MAITHMSDVIVVGGHRFVYGHVTDQRIDEAAHDIQSLDASLFDRYDNPFEQKWTLRKGQMGIAIPMRIMEMVRAMETWVTPIADAFGIGTDHLITDPDHHYTGIFRYGPQDKLDVHVDAGIHPNHDWLRKHITMLLYLGEGGGPLELWEGDSCMGGNDYHDPLIRNIVHTIEPTHGTVVIFENNDHAWHGVKRVGDDSTTRMVITTSFLSDWVEGFPDCTNQRQRAYFINRPNEVWDDEMVRMRNLRADPDHYSEAYKM